VCKVYLAGPIEGCTDDEVLVWRQSATLSLGNGIKAISPVKIDSTFASAIITQNKYDVAECDVTLAYLPKCISDRRCSYGTICEIAWAHAHNKPVVIVSDDPYIHEHPVIQQIGVHFAELNNAVEYINQLLSQHV
jgi:nucleoside 2-deoxyribosyltransferase|tara:strand:- start:324 stop:728 length:405 start_codon:yes stop_codon:yes gene_type:complete